MNKQPLIVSALLASALAIFVYLLFKPTVVDTPEISFQFENTFTETNFTYCASFTKPFNDNTFFSVPTRCYQATTDSQGIGVIPARSESFSFPYSFGTRLQWIEVREGTMTDEIALDDQLGCMGIATFWNEGDWLPAPGPMSTDFTIQDAQADDLPTIPILCFDQ